jgi:hypothetical protein
MEPVARNNIWKILIGLAVVCGLLVFAGGFFHRRALEQSVQDAQDSAALYIRTKLTHDVAGMDLSEPLKNADATALTKGFDLQGETGLRIFAPNGTPVFTADVPAFPADGESLATAKSGGVARVIDGADLRVYAPIDGKGGRIEAVGAVVWKYTQMRKEATGPLDDYRLPLVGLGVLLLIAGVVLMLQATKGSAPATVVAPKAVAPARPAKGRVTGFEPVAAPTDAQARSAAAAQLQAAVTEASATAMGATMETPAETPKSRFSFGKRSTADAEPKEKRSLFARKGGSTETTAVDTPQPAGDASASALQREIAIRQALEDQLEQLRTQVKTAQDERTTATRTLTEQLEAAVHRAEEAEAQLELAGGATPATAAAGAAEAAAATARIAALEQELAQTRTAATEAKARADQLLQAAQAAPPAPMPDPAAEKRVAELGAQLADAQQRATSAEQRASAAEQRAASVESVRDELEVRVAQLATKATDLERRAAELEGNLQEANAGGDAVRAEIATLTAALAGANARVQELESVASAPSVSPEHEAELTHLRGELAKQLERAQSAEDRIASLEADVLAAQRGVRSLPTDQEPPVAAAPSIAAPSPTPVAAPTPVASPRPVASETAVPPAPSGDDRYDDMWSAPSVPQQPAAAQPSRWSDQPLAPTPSAEHNGHGGDETDASETEGPRSTPADETDEDLPPEDMWSLRARLADAASRKRDGID